MTETAAERVEALAARHTRVVRKCAGAEIITTAVSPELAADIAAAIRAAEAAVRAECVAVVRRLSRLHALSREELCGGIMAAIESMPLEPPA